MRQSVGAMLALLLTAGCAVIGTDEGNRDGTCGEHSSCPSDQACGAGQCVDLLNRTYLVTQVDVELCSEDLDGVPFDSGDGSSPDPQVELRFGGQTVYTSGVQSNALEATFSVTDTEVVIQDFSDTFVVEVRDDDGDTSQLMDTLSVDVSYPGLRVGEVVVVNEADCSESPVTRVGVLLQAQDGAW